MTKNSLPQMPGGITPEWLTAVLQDNGTLSPGVVISAIKREQVGEGVGMMSELSRLIPTYVSAQGAEVDSAPASFIAKYPSQIPANREVAMLMNLYEREVRYFAELDSLTSAQSPRAYLTDLEGDNFIILMEDMAEYRVGDQIVGATLVETELAIDELAKLHSAFWEKVSDIAWIPHVSNSYHATNLANLAVSGWDNMQRIFADVLPEHFLARKDDVLSSLPALQAHADRAPITLAHGDFRMENLLYGTQPEHHPVVIIDWQGPLLGRGMQDVALLMGQSTQTEVRRAHEKALLQRYLDGLEQFGVKGYGFDQAWDDYRHTHLHSWTYAIVVSGALDASNERAFAWMSQMLARQVATTDDLELLDLLPFQGKT
ncbi:MAG: phosphotransferase [Pseudomonadales bacterium]